MNKKKKKNRVITVDYREKKKFFTPERIETLKHVGLVARDAVIAATFATLTSFALKGAIGHFTNIGKK